MKTSEIFAKCIPLIESGEREFICHAIYQVAYGNGWMAHWVAAKNGVLHDPYIKPCIDIITSTLDHYGAFSIIGLFYGVNCAEGYGINGKNLRLWWLHNLVRQYESLGD